jgi:inorganic pyrophosphatase
MAEQLDVNDINRKKTGKKLLRNDLNLKQRESYSYIGKTVQVEIDRPLNSKHPKHGFIYPVNYGFVPNTVSGDGEEIDCYVLGVDKPLKNFTGKCVAVIHRTNDNDDKLIIVPEDKDITDEEIRELTNFQEQYFESEIIR